MSLIAHLQQLRGGRVRAVHLRGSRQDQRKVSLGRLFQLRIKSLPKGARVTCLTSASGVRPPLLPLKPLLQSII